MIFFLDNKKGYNTDNAKTNLNTLLNLIKCFFILKIVVILDLLPAKKITNKDLLLISLILGILPIFLWIVLF